MIGDHVYVFFTFFGPYLVKKEENKKKANFCLRFSHFVYGGHNPHAHVEWMHADASRLMVVCSSLWVTTMVYVIVFYHNIIICHNTSCCKSTYFLLHHHFQWSYCSVYMLHTGPSLPDLLLAWPRHQGRKLCVQHTLLDQHCMAWWHAFVAISIHPPWKHPTPHQTIIDYFLPFSVTLDSFRYSTMVAISCPPHFLLAICLWLMPAYSVWVVPIQQPLAKVTLGDRFQRGTLLCDSALSLPLATQFWRNI